VTSSERDRGLDADPPGSLAVELSPTDLLNEPMEVVTKNMEAMA
jgi:hypothetical protein